MYRNYKTSNIPSNKPKKQKKQLVSKYFKTNLCFTLRKLTFPSIQGCFNNYHKVLVGCFLLISIFFNYIVMTLPCAS